MKWLALALAVFATGCGYVEMHDAVLRPPSAPTAKVELYVGEQTPGRPFYEVALVQVYGYGSEADVENMSRALEERGRALGCDALLRTHFDMGRSIGHGYGVCVRWSAVAPPGTVQTGGAPPSETPL